MYILEAEQVQEAVHFSLNELMCDSTEIYSVCGEEEIVVPKEKQFNISTDFLIHVFNDIIVTIGLRNSEI